MSAVAIDLSAQVTYSYLQTICAEYDVYWTVHLVIAEE